MTNERMEQIAQVLLDKGNEAKALYEMEPVEAAKRLTEEGFPVSAEELTALGEAIVKANQTDANGELDEGQLDAVAGGCGKCLAAVAKAIYEIFKNHPW